MRGDGQVTDARTVGQDHGHRWGRAAVAAPGVQDVGDGSGAQRVTPEGDLDGGGEGLGPIVLQERQQPDQMGSEDIAALGQAGQERGGDRDGEAQAIAGARGIRLLGGREEPGEMRRVLDRLSAVVAADMARDLVEARDDPNRGRAGQERERATHVGMGNRVPVAIEGDVRQVAGHDRPHQFGLEGMRGQRQEPRLLCREDLRDRLVAVLGMRTLMRDLVPPALKLRVEIVDIAKRPRREEGIPEVPDLALDLALLISARRRTGSDRKMIMPRELEQARVEADRGPLALKHGGLEIVVHQGSRDAQHVEGLDMPAEKALECLVQREVREERARVREDHHETGQGPGPVADADRAETAPIHLGLFSWQDDEAAVQRHPALRPDHADETPELVGRSRVTTGAQHRIQPRAAQPRILRERLANEGQIRVQDRAATGAPSDDPRVEGEGGLHGVRVDAELRDDGPDFPMLAEIESADFGVLLGRDHAGPFSARRAPATSRARPIDSRGHRHNSTAWRERRARRPAAGAQP